MWHLHLQQQHLSSLKTVFCGYIIINDHSYHHLNHFHKHHDDHHYSQRTWWSGTQVVWRWHRWQRIQTTLRWWRASGWGLKIWFQFQSKCISVLKGFIFVSFTRWAFMTRRTRPLWESAFVENFLLFYISIFTLFIFIPNRGIVHTNIYLLTIFGIRTENQPTLNIEQLEWHLLDTNNLSLSIEFVKSFRKLIFKKYKKKHQYTCKYNL